MICVLDDYIMRADSTFWRIQEFVREFAIIILFVASFQFRGAMATWMLTLSDSCSLPASIQESIRGTWRIGGMHAGRAFWRPTSGPCI